jgi:hypothetical protein
MDNYISHSISPISWDSYEIPALEHIHCDYDTYVKYNDEFEEYSISSSDTDDETDYEAKKQIADQQRFRDLFHTIPMSTSMYVFPDTLCPLTKKPIVSFEPIILCTTCHMMFNFDAFRDYIWYSENPHCPSCKSNYDPLHFIRADSLVEWPSVFYKHCVVRNKKLNRHSVDCG